VTCVACRMASADWMCARCRRSLAVAPDQVLDGVLVKSVFCHEGAARLLMHRLKYEAVSGIAVRLAVVLEPLLSSDCTAVIPIPRVTARRWEYGVDPARDLATALGRRTGLPVIHALGPQWWVRRRAGGRSARRGVPAFEQRATAPAGAVLIDDVVTTGTTLGAAAALTGCYQALTVTAAGTSRGRGRAR
jgi:predicted amidophosphoribosyltransferase